MPSEGTETTEADTQSFQPAQATDDRAFDDARAEAMPLILKAEDELDQVDVPYTLDTSSVAPTIPDLVLIVWWTNLLVVAVGILNLRRDRVGVAGGLFLAAALTVGLRLSNKYS